MTERAPGRSREGFQHKNLYLATGKDSSNTKYRSAVTNCSIDWESVSTLECVQDWHMYGIKEAIHIRQNPNNMNRSQSKRYLKPAVWNSPLSPGPVHT